MKGGADAPRAHGVQSILAVGRLFSDKGVFMKRLLRGVAKLLLGLVLLVVLGVVGLLGGVYFKYARVVGTGPGTLETDAQPGAIGAKVDPFIGTGGIPFLCGHNTPAALMPLGMVRLGPDTRSWIGGETAFNRSGYYYGDEEMLGFSHTRLVGADAQEGGVFRVLPSVAGRIAEDLKPERALRFSHADEKALPGYYAVLLRRDDVLAEMTAGTRVGVHRYSWRAGGTPHLVVDLASAIGKGRTSESTVQVAADGAHFEGSVRLSGSF